jgi:hypothetical protein
VQSLTFKLIQLFRKSGWQGGANRLFFRNSHNFEVNSSFLQGYLLKNQYSIPMLPNIQNQQDRLAEIFRQRDNQITQESKVAFLKIQSWQFAMRTPEIGQSYLKEAASMIKQSLLSFVPNTFVLSEEGYYIDQTEN